MKEIWLPVPRYFGLYEVSNRGRVRSVSRRVPFGLRMRFVKGRVLRQTVQKPMGYRGVMLCACGVSVTKRVHRIVAAAFLPGWGPVVRHLDGDGSNNKASNLAYGSHAENEADKAAHGRVPRGEQHTRSVITGAIARKIRKMHARGLTQLRIAAELGLKRGVVGTVVRGERWKAAP